MNSRSTQGDNEKYLSLIDLKSFIGDIFELTLWKMFINKPMWRRGEIFIRNA